MAATEAEKDASAELHNIVESMKREEALLSETLRRKGKLTDAREELTSLEVQNKYYDQQLRAAKKDFQCAKAKLDQDTERMKSKELRIGEDCLKIEELEETLERERNKLQTASDELEKCRERIVELNDHERTEKDEL
jgi:chromosome segregation ATPase